MNDFTPDPDRISHRLRCLEAENAALRERIAILETLTGMDYRAPAVLGLEPALERILGVLLAHERVPLKSLVQAARRQGPYDEPTDRVVHVQIHKLRRALEPYGIGIDTLHSYGYAIPAFMKDRFDSAFGKVPA